MTTVHDCYTFSAMAGVSISDACNLCGEVTARTVSTWRHTGSKPTPHKLKSLEDSLIDLAYKKGVLAVEKWEHAQLLGVSGLVSKGLIETGRRAEG